MPLPIDIHLSARAWYLIMQYLCEDKSTIASLNQLGLSCRRLHVLARPLLLRNVVLHVPQEVERFNTCLDVNPENAFAVLFLTLCSPTADALSRVNEAGIRTWSAMMLHTVQRCKRLVELSVWQHEAFNWYAKIFEHTRYPDLRVIRVNVSFPDTRTYACVGTPVPLGLLERQAPQLEHTILSDAHDPAIFIVIPSTAAAPTRSMRAGVPSTSDTYQVQIAPNDVLERGQLRCAPVPPPKPRRSARIAAAVHGSAVLPRS